MVRDLRIASIATINLVKKLQLNEADFGYVRWNNKSAAPQNSHFIQNLTAEDTPLLAMKLMPTKSYEPTMMNFPPSLGFSLLRY